MELDLLAISPHPDDAEIHCGGLLLKSKLKGYKTGILYMTKGEMSTEGNTKIRLEETKKALEILKVDHFDYAGFKDCMISDSFASRLIIARFIRQLKPKTILMPYWKGYPGRGHGHTDHIHTGILASHAVNFARLKKMPLDEEPHIVSQVLYYLFPRNMKPTFVVDISDIKDDWINAIKAHNSQMFGNNASKTGFYNFILAQATSFGYYIGSPYAHGFVASSPLKIDDPLSLA